MSGAITLARTIRGGSLGVLQPADDLTVNRGRRRPPMDAGGSGGDMGAVDGVAGTRGPDRDRAVALRTIRRRSLGRGAAWLGPAGLGLCALFAAISAWHAVNQLPS